MKTIKSLILSLVICLLFLANVKAQDEIDTLYLFPDTTTFINWGVTVTDNIDGLAIKLYADTTWDAFSIEKILSINVDTIGFSNTSFAISVGSIPEETILYESSIIPVLDIYPEWTEYDISPPVKIEDHSTFYISGVLLFMCVTSYLSNQTILNHFIHDMILNTWFEGAPYYLPIKALVKRITTDVKDFKNSNNLFYINQNYPNPFNGSTIIEYTIKEESRVEISVYNMLGENITTIVNEEMPAGIHKINFEPKNIPSGMYLYRIIAGDFISSRKMIYIK
jgi:hypothetical protein